MAVGKEGEPGKIEDGGWNFPSGRIILDSDLNPINLGKGKGGSLRKLKVGALLTFGGIILVLDVYGCVRGCKRIVEGPTERTPIEDVQPDVKPIFKAPEPEREKKPLERNPPLLNPPGVRPPGIMEDNDQTMIAKTTRARARMKT